MLYLAVFLLRLIYFALGACFFSFFCVVAERLPRGETILRGRSHCTACGHTLSAWELIPCLSYLCLRRRCKACGAPIPMRCFVMEALGGLTAIACAARFGGIDLRFVLVFAAISILAIVALMDIDTMEIWDRFSLMLALCGLAAIPLFPAVTLVERLIGVVAVSLPMLLLALVIPGAFGGGDIKLMAAAGLLLGWQNTLCAAFLALLGGGAWGASLLIRKKAGRGDHFAFGPFLCAGIAVALLWGDAIIAAYLGLY